MLEMVLLLMLIPVFLVNLNKPMAVRSDWMRLAIVISTASQAVGVLQEQDVSIFIMTFNFVVVGNNSGQQ